MQSGLPGILNSNVNSVNSKIQQIQIQTILHTQPQNAQFSPAKSLITNKNVRKKIFCTALCNFQDDTHDTIREIL